MDMTSILNTVLKGGATDGISKATGTDSSTVEKVIQAGLPVIIGQMAKNASTPEGASKLDTAVAKDHGSGALLDSLGSLFGGGDSNADGDKILGHVLDSEQETANQKIANKTGVDAATVAKILSFLAPLVMAYLAKKKSSDNLDAGGVSDVLNQQKTSSGNPLSDIATAMLDKNGDGSILDDIVGGFFKKS